MIGLGLIGSSKGRKNDTAKLRFKAGDNGHGETIFALQMLTIASSGDDPITNYGDAANEAEYECGR
jgi:hypothetical protein